MANHQSINTSGGALVEGNIDTGGDFIGRDATNVSGDGNTVYFIETQQIVVNSDSKSAKPYHSKINAIESDEKESPEVTTFVELARQIWPLMATNGRAFMSFGPNSGAESAAPVRWHLDLWENAKKEIIFPNNRKILTLINKNYAYIPQIHASIFDQMLAHIYAFEKHCENPSLDYSDHQFPVAFAKIVDDTCAQEAENGETDVEEIGKWLLRHFDKLSLQVVNAHLIGSVLRGIFPGADVDVFLLLDDSNPVEIKISNHLLENMKQDFLLAFGRPLHVIAFSKTEKQQYHSFLNKLTRIRRFL